MDVSGVSSNSLYTQYMNKRQNGGNEEADASGKKPAGAPEGAQPASGQGSGTPAVAATSGEGASGGGSQSNSNSSSSSSSTTTSYLHGDTDGDGKISSEEQAELDEEERQEAILRGEDKKPHQGSNSAAMLSELERASRG